MEHDPSVEDMPVRGEPLAVDLVNTTFMVDGTRGHVVDVLASPGMLLEWLSSRSDDMGSQLVEQLAQAGINGEAVRRFQALRAALRELLAAETGHAPRPLDAVEAVNLAARGAAWWEEFSAAAPGEAVDVWSTSDWVAASLARVARSGVSILSGRQRALIRACSAPGCILFFVQSHLRRKWCSAKCGNRARVSRHNRRRRSGQLRVKLEGTRSWARPDPSHGRPTAPSLATPRSGSMSSSLRSGMSRDSRKTRSGCLRQVPRSRSGRLDAPVRSVRGTPVSRHRLRAGIRARAARRQKWRPWRSCWAATRFSPGSMPVRSSSLRAAHPTCIGPRVTTSSVREKRPAAST